MITVELSLSQDAKHLFLRKSADATTDVSQILSVMIVTSSVEKKRCIF